MKGNKLLKAIACVMTSVMIVATAFSATPLTVHAETTTVTGTVQAGTDSSILNLKTPQGDMVIKLDSTTDTSTCKLLIVGKTLYVDVYYGSDAYMHASKISTTGVATGSSSTASTSTITGKIANKAMNGDILYVDMNGDEMQLKLDYTTDYSGCGVLYAGKSISAVVYRGDDAYMHAKSISDGASSSQGNTSTTTNVNTSTYTGETTAVTGTVTSDSKGNLLYLKSADGTYTLKLDSVTSYTNGYMLISGKKVTANIYYGSDAYMHVAYLTRTGSLSQTSSGSTTMNFTGTVDGSSSDSMLYLKTSGGTMSIKLDSNTQCSSPVFKGSSVSVDCTNCTDGYWHATNISVSNSSASSSTTSTTTTQTTSGTHETTAVTGTVKNTSKGNTLYISNNDGTYTIKLDSTTNYSNGFMAISGQKVTANIYRGDDAYMHADSIVRTGSLSSTSSGSTSMTFTGTVSSSSKDSTLYLSTSGGTMTIKLDSNTKFTGSTPIYTNSSVSVTCTNCTDGYWHATSISLN